MPATPSPGDPVVDVRSDEWKVPQPLFRVEWDQGPELVNDKTDYPPVSFNPQRIDPIGDGRDEYPANPVIAWHNWTYRDPSQSLKVPNTGGANITPRAPLDQQRGRQSPPVLFPNMVTQSPPDWDDDLTVAPQDNSMYLQDVGAARIAAAQKYAALQVNVVS